MAISDEGGQATQFPRRELAAIVETLASTNPKCYSNAIDLAHGISASPSEFTWLLVKLLPQLESCGAFWKDETRVEGFVNKLPKDEGVLSEVLNSLTNDARATDRTVLLLARVLCSLNSLASPMLAVTVAERLDGSRARDASVVTLQLSRFLEDDRAHVLLFARLGDPTAIALSFGTGTATIGEYAAKLLLLRGDSSGRYLLQHFEELVSIHAKIQAIGVFAGLRFQSAETRLCHLLQDTTFGSVIAEAMLSDKIFTPLLRTAAEAGVVAAARDIVETRRDWKPRPDESLTADANIDSFLSKLHERSFLNKLGSVLVSSEFFYSFVRLFFNLKILAAVRYLVSDSDREVRVACAAALGVLEGPTVVRSLKEALFDRASEVRDAALDSVRKHLSDAEIETLLAERRARNEEIRKESQDAKNEFETIKIENKFLNAVKTLAFSTSGLVSSAVGSLRDSVKSVFGRKTQASEEDNT